MKPAICLLPVVPMRKDPSHRSEMVSQLLFGEYVRMGEEKDDFVWVQCVYDGYEGWVQASQLTLVTESQVHVTDEFIGVFTEEVFIDGLCRMMPLGTPIYKPRHPAEPLAFGNRKIIYNVLETAVWSGKDRPLTAENLEKLVWLYLETPYLWGGKSVFGIDCSGFAQQVFKLFGVKLLRDAYLQAEQGTAVESLEEAKMGDLAFFRNEKGRVVHVGILLSNKKIAHAAGKVRIDPIDPEGITNQETGKRTHQLCGIRRFF
jgi:hypothetical protein